MVEKQRISSILVPIYKAVPLLPLTSAIYWTVQDLTNITKPGLLFAIAWGVVWYVFTFRWKSVQIVGSNLRVSNYSRKDNIPVSNIRWIEGSSFWGWQPQTVTISFKSQTAFGDEIVFVPAGGWMWAEKFAESLRCQLKIEQVK